MTQKRKDKFIPAKLANYGINNFDQWFSKSIPVKAWLATSEPVPVLCVHIAEFWSGTGGTEVTIPIKELKKALRNL